MDPKIILIEGVSLKMKYPRIIPKIIMSKKASCKNLAAAAGNTATYIKNHA